VSIYMPKKGEMTQQQVDERVATQIRDALQNDRLRLVFQPIVSLHGDPGERYEVLLRMLDKEGQEIDAKNLFPSAERTGMAVGLDRWVLINSLKKLSAERQSGKDTIFLIKLTASSLQDPWVLPWLTDRLKDDHIVPGSVVFEIKEEIVVNFLKQAKVLVKGLDKLQCKFALDDFGTGVNSIQLLKTVNAHYAKIDYSLMDNITENEENQEAIRNINNETHNIEKLTVAPGVEDAAALSLLWGIGVNYIQGKFLQAPSEELNYDFSELG